MRPPLPFSADLLTRVLDFECGDETWEREVADWIKVPLDGNGALRAKLTLSLLGLIPSPTMRLPQAAAGDDEVREVREGLVAAGLLHEAAV